LTNGAPLAAAGLGLDRYGFIVFEEGFDVTGDGVLNHVDYLVVGVALSVAAGKGRDVGDEAAGFIIGFEDDGVCICARDQVSGSIAYSPG
jgi:hypothetical protein